MSKVIEKEPELKKDFNEVVGEVLSENEMKEALGLSLSNPNEPPSNVHRLFTEFFRSPDSIKISNLTDEELSSVRNLRDGANFFAIMDSPIVAMYLQSQGETILASALSKKGFFVHECTTVSKDIKLKASKGKSFKKSWLSNRRTEIED